MKTKLLATFRILFLICFLAMVFYITYDLGKLSGERLLPNRTVAGGTEGQLTNRENHQAINPSTTEGSIPYGELVSCKTTILRRIRSPQWQTVIHTEGIDVILFSEEWARIKQNIGVTKMMIYKTLRHPDWVSKGKEWIFYKRDSKKYYFAVEVNSVGVVKDAYYTRSGR